MIEYFSGIFSGEENLLLTLTFFTTTIVIYSIFIFFFYRFMAKKNIIELNLNQYNRYDNPAIIKLFAAFFYIIEYILLLPLLTFFWFTTLSILILLLSKGVAIETVLLISAALVASVRATSYVSENLSKDLAKMVPFTLLAIAITTPGFFNINTLLSQTINIPSLLSNIPYYLLFIVAIELIMRTADFIQSAASTTK